MARSATGNRQQSRCVASASVESDRLHQSAQAEVQVRIGARLRALWADLLVQPVPAHLLHLVRAFERKRTGTGDER